VPDRLRERNVLTPSLLPCLSLYGLLLSTPLNELSSCHSSSTVQLKRAVATHEDMPSFAGIWIVTPPAQNRVTEIVAGLVGEGGDAPASAEELLPLVYQDLRRLAQRYMSREHPGHTLQPTALVHEVYLKLVDQTRANWKGKSHFFAVGALAMRRLLIDHARARRREKRGGARQRVTLAESLFPSNKGTEGDLDFEELLSLNTALERLAAVEPRAAKVVELRFFGGLTVPEVAHVLEVSTRTVEGDWTYARAWLRRELSGEDHA
jgi:RNA polymerase sigma factor (TIGR02999 family)